jgi:nicotinate-nucleotide pyrophosphorylase (carboxylating)
MIENNTKDHFRDFINKCLIEDAPSGDHTSNACIPETAMGFAELLVKENGILAGVELAEIIFKQIHPGLEVRIFKKDGEAVISGDIALSVQGNIRAILKAERLVLNCMQRMSGIATLTHIYVKALEGTGCTLLDTRKTTPGFREMEKWAVRIGGGTNHRFGLSDMIMLKDNHIDYAGGIEPAIIAVHTYLSEKNLKLKIEIEARNMEEVALILKTGKIDRIMLDNFEIPQLKKAVALIAGRYETEASGGINLENIRDIAVCGVNFISSGALTHSYKSMDLSLKAVMIKSIG